MTCSGGTLIATKIEQIRAWLGSPMLKVFWGMN